MSILSNYSEGQKNFGLLLLRIGIGVMFIMHGYPKLIGGPERWESLGAAMKNLGVEYVPVVWGFLGAITETFGGFLLMVGILFRPACLFLMFMMIVAASTHFDADNTLFKNIMSASHVIEAGILFLSLLFIGPGNYRFQKVVIE
ncbi:MAG TPA: DoxX family protein [Chitinophagales bacterium]|nr:DoxX family protein [Chitinophagales bacterium]